MSTNGVNPLGSTNTNALQQTTKQTQQQKVTLDPSQDTLTLTTSTKLKKEKNAGLIAGVVAGAVALVAAGTAIYKGKGGKATKTITKGAEELTNAAEQAVKGLEDIEFNKGVAKLKDDGSKFTGKISDTLKNGNKIELEYKDGYLQKSIKTDKEGKELLSKTYGENGYRSITIKKNEKLADKELASIRRQRFYGETISDARHKTITELENFDRTGLSKNQNKKLDEIIQAKKARLESKVSVNKTATKTLKNPTRADVTAKFKDVFGENDEYMEKILKVAGEKGIKDGDLYTLLEGIQGEPGKFEAGKASIPVKRLFQLMNAENFDINKILKGMEIVKNGKLCCKQEDLYDFLENDFDLEKFERAVKAVGENEFQLHDNYIIGMGFSDKIEEFEKTIEVLRKNGLEPDRNEFTEMLKKEDYSVDKLEAAIKKQIETGERFYYGQI